MSLEELLLTVISASSLYNVILMIDSNLKGKEINQHMVIIKNFLDIC